MKRLIFFLLAFSFLHAIQAQVIVPTQTDEIIIDNGSSGKADPNDRIRYKVTIQNTGGTNGNGTQLNIVPDPRTSFVPGSFRSSALAVPDGPYACTGNVGINIPAVSGLKANDFDDNISGATITAGTFATTQGGSIIITADGGFTYTPPAGFTGSDSYSYTLNDGNPVGLPVPLTDMATVTFTVSNMIWFISNVGGGSGGTGTRLNPFKTLADFNVASGTAAGHVVHLQFTGADYPGGIVLKNNMLLFGTGHTGGLTLADVLPFALAPNSPTLPAINGTRPVVENSGGDGILLASGNTIRGLNIGNCSDFGIDDNGNVGTLTISELNISTTGGGFRADNGGTLAVTLGSLASTGGTNGLHLGTTSGTFSVTGSTSVTNSSGVGINIANTSGGSVSFNTLTVGGSGSHGIELASNAATFTVTGNTTLNSPVAGGNLSLFISSGIGAITFSGIDINGRRDKGIRIAGGTRNITTGALDIDNPNSITASAMEINAPTGGTISFGATTINNNGANGSAIEIQNNTASVSFASGSSITNCAGTDFFCNLGTGNVTFDGSINSTGGGSVTVQSRTSGTVSFQGNITHNAAATAININNNTGGTINFSGSSKSLTSSTSDAISIVSNTGAAINFPGGNLIISSSSGSGFNATGGGTVTVQGTGNTINSSSGATALNVVNTTIGGSGMTFQSIASNGGSATGIILDNTGSGGLTVTGTGSAGSGGTIANKTGANGSTTTGIGIYLNSCSNVSLTRMQLNNFTNFGIRGFIVNNFTMDNCVVNHSSGKNGDDDATDEGSIYFGAENPGGTNGLTGTVTITNCLIEDGFENNFKIANLSGTLSQFTMTGTTIRDNSTLSPGNNGFEIRAQGTANITADITTSTFTGNRANGIQVTTTTEHTGTVDVEIGIPGVAGSGGTFTNNNIGVNIAHGSAGILNFDVHRGTFNSSPGLASPININLAGGGGGPISGSITNNSISNANSPTGPGIRVTTNGTDADGSNVLTIQISNNNISQIGNRGIEMIARDGNSDIIATVTNNTITLTDPLAADAIHIASGATAADLTSICATISGNIATTVAGNQGIQIRNRFAGTTFRLPSYGGAATDPDGTHDAVIAHLLTLNPATPVITADHQVGNSGFTPGGAPCNIP